MGYYCGDEECSWHEAEEDNKCTKFKVIWECGEVCLIIKKEPVAEVPCGDGLCETLIKGDK
jgi:hypothetical protein